MAEGQVSKTCPGPVFIVGMNGSGTTMMLDHLGRHPELFGFSLETYVLPYYLINQSRYGDLAVDQNFLSLWNDMRSEYPFRRVNAGRPPPLPADWADVSRNASTVFDRIMRGFASGEGKTRWCEKTPMYAMHISILAQAYPDSCFIHMIRDGRDCAASNYRRWGRHPANEIYRWKQVILQSRHQARPLAQRYMEIRYEDIIQAPKAHMRAVCNFLGVAYDEVVLQSNRRRHFQGGHSNRAIGNRPAKKSAGLPAKTLRDLEKIAGSMLAELGYETRYLAGDIEPGTPRKAWWFVHDLVVVLSRQLKNKMTVQKHMTWSLFTARLRATVRLFRLSTGGKSGVSDKEE